MDKLRHDADSEDTDRYINCVEPQAVLKSNIVSFESDSLGAFILAAVEIIVENDLEGGETLENSSSVGREKA